MKKEIEEPMGSSFFTLEAFILIKWIKGYESTKVCCKIELSRTQASIDSSYKWTRIKVLGSAPSTKPTQTTSKSTSNIEVRMKRNIYQYLRIQKLILHPRNEIEVCPHSVAALFLANKYFLKIK